MNTSDITTRPFGYWITAVDRLMKAEFATIFADEGITRRDWRMLNVIDGTAPARVPGRPLRGPKLRRLTELGWIERSTDGWSLTDAGRLAKTRLGVAVDDLRARVSGAVTADEYAALTASLEKIAREFGWEEGMRLPRHHREGHRGLGPGVGHGRRHGFVHEPGCDHGGHGHHGHRFGPRGMHRHGAPATHIHIHTHS